MADKEQPGTKADGWKITAFIAIGLLVLGIVYFSLKSGLFVQKLSVPGMVELQFAERAGLGSTAKPEQANDPGLKVNQAQLEQKLSELERRLAERDAGTGAAGVNGGGIAVPPQPITSLYGRWSGPQGLAYVIQQQGAYITIQEMNPWLGVTAVGEGTISGNILNISYTTAIGTSGQAQLQISPDGRQMWGQSRDMVTGITVPMQLQR